MGGINKRTREVAKTKEPTMPSAETARKMSLCSHLCHVSAQREALLR